MNKKIKTIADHFGPATQIKKTAEESLEVAEAANDFHCALVVEDDSEELARKRAHFIEELADESIMIEQMIYQLKAEKEFEEVRKQKIARTLERIVTGYYA